MMRLSYRAASPKKVKVQVPAVCVLLFEASRPIKPTSLIRDADLESADCRPPGSYPDVGSSETELRRPTCPFVQVIIGPTRHLRDGSPGGFPPGEFCVRAAVDKARRG